MSPGNSQRREDDGGGRRGVRSLPQVHGRGASRNPANRFDEMEVVPDRPEGADDSGPRTRYFRDSSRSIIATNDSPDVGFDASVNPYRGCEHGCVYCLHPGTPVLRGDMRAVPIGDLRPGDRIYGTRRDGHYRKYVTTSVVAVWRTVKPAYRITLADGTRLVASGDHRFLTDRGWKYVTGSQQGATRRPHLTASNKLRGIGRLARADEGSGSDYRRGYVTGTGPAIARKTGIEGRAVESSADLGVRSIEPVGRRMPMVDITTGTGDFIADGVVSHNCYARPGHEYLGLSSGLDFETRIFVKENAPELLRRELSDPGWEPKPLVMSGVTDPYQPVERELEITRGCLEVLAEFRNPVSVITKNHGITRDLDLLGELADHGAASATLSITTLNPEIRRRMEPRTSSPRRRLRAIGALAEAGVPVGVNVAPVIPGLTDEEMPRILEAAAEAGASRAAYVLLRLPHAVEELFVEWLDANFPDRKEKVLGRLREMRGGQLYDATFGARMRGEGPFAEGVADLFRVTCSRLGLDGAAGDLSTDAFRRSHTRQQMELFT